MPTRQPLRRVSLFSLLALSLLSPLPGFAQAGAAALLAQLRTTKPVGAVALSPDGKTVAADLAGTLTLMAVGSQPGSGTALAPCAGATPHVSSLAWSPDSATLSALLLCGDSEVVEEIPASTHAPRILVTLHGYASDLSWTPDGKSLALLYVAGSSRPSGALAAKKPATGVIEPDTTAIQRLALIDAATGALQPITPANLHVYEYAVAPDSSRLAYIAAPPPGESNWWVAGLYTQAATPGSAPSLVFNPQTTPGELHGMQLAVPSWSPDGARIAFIGGLMSDQFICGGDLYTVPADGSAEPANATPGSKTSVEWLQWLANGHLIATVVNGGSKQIDDLSFPNGSTSPAEDKVLAKLPYSVPYTSFGGAIEVAKDGETVAWSASSFDTPPEVYAGPLRGKLPPALTNLNAALQPSWGKSESVEWTSEGFSVQGWLHYPAQYDSSKHYGLIVYPHGGPAWYASPRWPSARFGPLPFAAAGYFVLEPNPRGSFGQGEVFTGANRRDLGYGDLRDILAGVDAVEKKVPAIDDHRVGIAGWSYGGVMSAFAITQTHRFKAAIAGAGAYDWTSYYGESRIDQWMLPFFGDTLYNDPAVYARSSAIDFIGNASAPTLILVGEYDMEAPPEQSFELWNALQSFKVPTKLVVYPGEGHTFSNPAHAYDAMQRSVQWFDQYLR